MLNLPPHIVATLCGGLALVLWGFNATLYSSLQPLPTFQVISTIFGVSFLLSAIRLTLFKRWHCVSTVPLKFWGYGILGIYVANVCFVFALQYAPPENVELMSYIWPILALLFAPVLFQHALKPNHILGAGLSFLGLYLLLANSHDNIHFALHYWKGYILTIGYALCWSIYVVCTRKNQHIPNEMIGIYCGVAASISLFTHLTTETFMMPTLPEWGIMVLIGITGQGLAYFLWDHGIKYGHYALLCTLSYFTPILSIILLISFGFAQNHRYLGFATLLVCGGAFITSTYGFTKIKQIMK